MRPFGRDKNIRWVGLSGEVIAVMSTGVVGTPTPRIDVLEKIDGSWTRTVDLPGRPDGEPALRDGVIAFADACRMDDDPRSYRLWAYRRTAPGIWASELEHTIPLPESRGDCYELAAVSDRAVAFARREERRTSVVPGAIVFERSGEGWIEADGIEPGGLPATSGTSWAGIRLAGDDLLGRSWEDPCYWCAPAFRERLGAVGIGQVFELGPLAPEDRLGQALIAFDALLVSSESSLYRSEPATTRGTGRLDAGDRLAPLRRKLTAAIRAAERGRNEAAQRRAGVLVRRLERLARQGSIDEEAARTVIERVERAIDQFD